MKKLLSLLALALALLMLASCGGKKEPAKTESTTTAETVAEPEPDTSVEDATAALDTMFKCSVGEGSADDFTKVMYDPVIRDLYIELGIYEDYDAMAAEAETIISDSAEYRKEMEEEYGSYTTDYEILATYEYTDEQLAAFAKYVVESNTVYTVDDIEDAVGFEVEFTETYGEESETFSEGMVFIKVRGEWSYSLYTLDEAENPEDYLAEEWESEWESGDEEFDLVPSDEQEAIENVFNEFADAVFVNFDVEKAYDVSIDKYTLDAMIETQGYEDEAAIRAAIEETIDGTKGLFVLGEDEEITFSIDITDCGEFSAEDVEKINAIAAEEYGYPENTFEKVAVVYADLGYSFEGEESVTGEEFLMLKIEGVWYMSSVITAYDLHFEL